MEQVSNQTAVVVTPQELLHHWQGHRKLTRQLIEKFPEKEFFEFSIGGMRTFAELSIELLNVGLPGIREIVGNTTTEFARTPIQHDHKKENILKLWDDATQELNTLFPQIPLERYHERINLFGQYENTVWSSIFYFIDNEIHHRGQGYVYLRALGIEPPFFWDRP